MHSLRKKLSQKGYGFTLIEVLISAIILFSALAITAELYSASTLSANKASYKAHFYQVHSIAINSIKNQMRELTENRSLSELSNKFIISGIEYQWKATRYSYKARAPDFDDFMPPLAQFGLFNVQVLATLVSNSENSVKPETFEFKVATW